MLEDWASEPVSHPVKHNAGWQTRREICNPVASQRLSLVWAEVFSCNLDYWEFVETLNKSKKFLFSGGPDLAQYAGKKHINRGRWTKVSQPGL